MLSRLFYFGGYDWFGPIIKIQDVICCEGQDAATVTGSRDLSLAGCGAEPCL